MHNFPVWKEHESVYVPGLTSTDPLLELLWPLVSVTVRVKLYFPLTRFPKNSTAWWSELFSTSFEKKAKTKACLEFKRFLHRIFLYFCQWFRPHPGCRAAIISCPLVGKSTFIISGVRTIKDSSPERKRDGCTLHNTGYRRLVQFCRETK